MKILHLLSQRPECTGSGFFFSAMLKESAESGNKNHAVCGVTPGTIPEESIFYGASKDFIFFNGKDISFPIPGMSDVMPYESVSFKDLSLSELDLYKKIFLKKIESAVFKFKPDLILSHHLWIMTSIVKKNFPEIPMACISHGTDLRQLADCPDIKNTIKKDLKNMDLVYALSKEHKKNIKSCCGIPESCIDVCGSGFDEEIFKFRKKFKNSKVEILYAGKLSYAKGVNLLLKAAGKIDDLCFHLSIAGSGFGKEMEDCIRLAKENSDKVTMLGALSQKELSLKMQKSDIFILPSFFEGLPLVLLEALACGCRIVTTDLYGAREIFKGENSLVDYIKLPKLQKTDKPYDSDLIEIAEEIEKKLRSSILKVLSSEKTDMEKIIKIVSPYSWSRVYGKIQKGFAKII